MRVSNLPRKYFGIRSSENGRVNFDLSDLRMFLFETFEFFEEKGYFSEAFGSACEDHDDEIGYFDSKSSMFMKAILGKSNLWPLKEHYLNYERDDIFSVIEFLFDHVSKPTEETRHGWNNGCVHYLKFDKPNGQSDFLARINFFLEQYEEGWALSPSGQINSLPLHGFENLFVAELPSSDVITKQRLAEATSKFRRYRSTIDDRRNAVRDLADILERHRSQVKTALLKKDESDLFHLANSFGIRHFNGNQKLEYDQSIWLSWMFYYYLSTIHAVHHIIDRQSK